MSGEAAGESLPQQVRVLVIRLGAVGDVVRALAAVGVLRRERPGARIGWLVEESSRALVEGNPAVDEVFVFERRPWREPGGIAGLWRALKATLDLRRRLKAGRYDVALDMQGTLKSALWAVASGARRRVGFARGAAREGAWLLMGERVEPPPAARSRLEQFAALVGALGIGAGEAAAARDAGGPPPEELRAPLPPLDAERGPAGRWVAERGLGHKPWVVLYPGSSQAQQFKRWPAARFAEAGRRLAARGVGVVIGWGPGEEALAQEVESGCAGGAHRAPAGDLLDLAALLSMARAFVGNDSGPMHLAWAVGTPVVGLFGPTDPALNAPPGDLNRILYFGPPRRAGERRARRPLHLDQISAEDVEKAVLEILERVGTGR